MSVARTPTKNSSKSISPTHYGSDSAIYTLESHEHNIDVNIKKRSKRRLNNPPSTSDLTLADLMVRLDEMNKLQDAKFASLESSMNALSKQNDEIKDTVIHLSAKYDDVLNNLKKLQQENDFFKNRIKTLEGKLEQLEKNARTTTVEIRNVPMSESEDKENLIEFTKKFGTVINVPIQDSEIRDVFRMKLKNKPNGPIIVDFTSTVKREKVIKATRTYNKMNTGRLSTASFNMDGAAKPIYVSEHLTASTRHLFYLARMFANKHNYENCWTSFGKVYLKRNQNESRIHVSCQEDIVNLQKNI
ncbi:unnamed protein product [Parnassius apollo]|uniref:(apollo) hypothetical protein n=1 Tax=Parnassius apollo TaxID=110799 RepID=A0A8S3XH47_PARAO|nr:unnamed protein product [Parnassius apollo]